MSMAEEIGKLNELRQNGALTEDEYQKAKDSLLVFDYRSRKGEQWRSLVVSVFY